MVKQKKITEFEPQVIYADIEGYNNLKKDIDPLIICLNNTIPIWKDLFKEKLTPQIVLNWISYEDLDKHLKRKFIRNNDIKLPLTGGTTVNEEKLMEILNFPEGKFNSVINNFRISQKLAVNLNSKGISLLELYNQNTQKFQLSKDLELKLFEIFEVRTKTEKQNQFIETLHKLQECFIDLEEFGCKPIYYRHLNGTSLRTLFKPGRNPVGELEINPKIIHTIFQKI